MISMEKEQLGIKWTLRYSRVEGLHSSHPEGLKREYDCFWGMNKNMIGAIELNPRVR